MWIHLGSNFSGVLGAGGDLPEYRESSNYESGVVQADFWKFWRRGLGPLGRSRAYLITFVMPGSVECKPLLPEGPFPLNQRTRAQGLQEGQRGQRPVRRTGKRKLVEAIVSQAREEL